MRNFFIKIFRYLCIVLVSTYLLTLLLLYLFQDKFLFFPPNPNPKLYQTIMGQNGVQVSTIQLSSGEILQGWNKSQSGNNITLFYFGGNAEDVAYMFTKFPYQNINLIAYNYPGYGSSSGKPSELNIFESSLEIYDTIIPDIVSHSGKIFVMGRSLGSGVATYLASQRLFNGVILVSPYDSIERVAGKIYWFYPIQFLMKNKFESYKYASMKNNKLLYIYGGKDRVIDSSHTENLISYWNGNKTRTFIDTANHDNILSYSTSWESIYTFHTQE